MSAIIVMNIEGVNTAAEHVTNCHSRWRGPRAEKGHHRPILYHHHNYLYHRYMQ